MEREPETPEPGVQEQEFDETPSDELMAALAGGGALSFEPDLDDDELLPGGARLPAVVTAPVSEATPDEIAAEMAREAAAREAVDNPAG
jgi:hypothetical protein